MQAFQLFLSLNWITTPLHCIRKIQHKNYCIMALVFQGHIRQCAGLIHDFFSTNVQFQDVSVPEKSKYEFQDFAGPTGTRWKWDWEQMNEDKTVLAHLGLRCLLTTRKVFLAVWVRTENVYALSRGWKALGCASMTVIDNNDDDNEKSETTPLQDIKQDQVTTSD